MANIRLDLASPVFDGQNLTFRSPVDCSQITGLKIYYYKNGVQTYSIFQFADSHGNNVGSLNLFAQNVMVKVILDTGLSRAYVQNADTNSYLETRLKDVPKLFHTIEKPEEKGPWIWLQSIRSTEIGVDDFILELSRLEPEDGDVIVEMDNVDYTVENASTNPDDVGEGEYLFDIEN